MIMKNTKTITQKEVNNNFMKLDTILQELSNLKKVDDLQPIQYKKIDLLNIQKSIIIQNLKLIIDAAFRGNEEYQSLKFDYSTDLMQELATYFNKNIGEKTKRKIESTIDSYFNDDLQDNYKIKCYLQNHYGSFSIDFLYTVNGFTYGDSSKIYTLYYRFDGGTPEHIFDLTKAIATYRTDGNYSSLSPVDEVITDAEKYYNMQLEASKKVKSMLQEINDIIATVNDEVPSTIRFFNKGKLWMDALSDSGFYNTISNR